MKVTRILLIMVFISCCLSSLSLRGQSTTSITIFGKVKEANTQNPIPYVTIVVIDKDGKTTGTVSSDDGSFAFTTTSGNKRIVISCIGYIKQTMNRSLMKSEDIGDVLLQPDTKLLSEVVVTGSKPIVRREIDKLVVDAKSLSVVSANAIDLLKRTPGLLVSEEGNVSVLGKGKLIILVNGRESHMTEQELAAYLKGMQSQDIERIEVMTTPPSKYSAEGDAGVINIVEHRKLSDFLCGSITDQDYTSKGHANDISGSLKYQRGQLFLYANSSIGFGNRKNKQIQEREYTEKDWNQTTTTRNENRYGSGDFGFEWMFSHNLNLGGQYSILYFSPDRTILEDVSLIEKRNQRRSNFIGNDQFSRKMMRHNGSLFVAKSWKITRS